MGPGRLPIPAKLVTQILAYKFIELSELIPENLEAPQNEVPSFLFDGRSIVPTTTDRARRTKSVIF